MPAIPLAGNNSPQPVMRRTVYWLFQLTALLSFGTFNQSFFHQGAAATPDISVVSPEQYIILVLWLSIIACTFLPSVMRERPPVDGLRLPALMLCYIVISPLWSEYPLNAAPKAVVFLIGSVGVWRLSAVLSTTDLFDILIRGLRWLMMASFVACLAMPSVAIAHDYFHEGNWQGVFDQKQDLGVTSAFFVMLMMVRTYHHRTLWNVFGVALGAFLEIQSGSRGGAVVAMIAPVLVIAAQRNPGLIPFITKIIFIDLLAANALIALIVYTGSDYIDLFGYELDFTERSFIWNYGLAHWATHPILGFGINGFWSNPQILWDFRRIHGWVLDNHHSGYVCIMVETGLIGMALSLKLVWDLSTSLRVLLRSVVASEPIEMALGTLLLLFQINFTETIFLRSTNYGQVAFSFILIKLLSGAARLRQTDRVNEIGRIPAMGLHAS